MTVPGLLLLLFPPLPLPCLGCNSPTTEPGRPALNPEDEPPAVGARTGPVPSRVILTDSPALAVPQEVVCPVPVPTVPTAPTNPAPTTPGEPGGVNLPGDAFPDDDCGLAETDELPLDPEPEPLPLVASNRETSARTDARTELDLTALDVAALVVSFPGKD